MGTLSVLELVQEFCGLKGLPIPSALVGATTASVVQYRAILNEALREAIAYNWPEVKVQFPFTTVATANQGALETLFPGFVGFVKDAMWMAPQTIPVRGPITDSTWAALTALGIAGPPYSFWLSQGDLYLTPTPPAGRTITAIYTTEYKYMNGSTPKRAITADSDTTIIPDRVIISGLKACWERAKGLDSWKESWQGFQSDISQSIASSQPTLALDRESNFSNGPKIFIPPGSWLT